MHHLVNSDSQIQLKWAMAQSIICKTALSTCFVAEGSIGEVIGSKCQVPLLVGELSVIPSMK